ncbi:Na(+)-translocating NADH-quinone reductase subunit A [Prolixibacter sp. NT017]|uniref:Na(+)-translocating NADH-quinone reductase subunit A n=1 Tax=Prolixibacter sp. NT017 TaxID=2652390 RepID=UPI001275DD1C|nr:Na(+)-translocating NADH-quinone reductase subunit A [Prolixibacter sp. NT017]GET26640.1 Na(+)-translocating NADH-quinone reductase subunit A [Prolixibacter sp. NT017]
MSNVIKLKRGLDIQLKGRAEKILEQMDRPDTFAIKPTDFHGLTPKLAAKEGDKVKAGSPLFFDKYQPEVKYVSPVSGEVVAVNRGERRKILEVVVKADGENLSEEFRKANPADLSRDEVREELLRSGLWPAFKMRPYGIVARPDENPRDIFISCFDSAPLAPDYDYILSGEESAWQTGLDALSKLTDGKIYLGLPAEGANKVFANSKGVEIKRFQGPHPAGNVGIQLHTVAPLAKNEVVWTIQPQDVVAIGKLFEKGIYDPSRIIAFAGSEVKEPRYYRTWVGANLAGLFNGRLTNDHVRFISGNVLTGTRIESDGFLGFYDSMVSVIPEGDYYEAFGWALPGLNKFSPSHTFFSWLGSKKKKYRLDTNMHGEERAFVVSGEYEKVLPMDILPVYLLKAILANDIDKMEKLGIYDVVEEDMALCEYVCTSKIQVQSILRKGIDSMIKELG